MVQPPIAPLFVPGDRPERFAKAAASSTDAVIIDLEDAVDGAFKEAARRNLLTHGVTGKPVLARINAASSEWMDGDLAVLADARLDGVILAKAESADEIAAVAKAAGPGVALIPLIETVLGLSRIDAILKAPQVLCAGFGSLDYGLDTGCEPGWEPLLHARGLLVFASRLAGVAAPIDGVTPTLDDPVLVEEEARRARAFGFGGKLAIHPKQVAPILAAFRPATDEIAWAQSVLAAATSGAAVKVDGKMVDKPVIEKARRIVQTGAGH